MKGDQKNKADTVCTRDFFVLLSVANPHKFRLAPPLGMRTRARARGAPLFPFRLFRSVGRSVGRSVPFLLF